jgi:hypothetical protein
VSFLGSSGMMRHAVVRRAPVERPGKHVTDGDESASPPATEASERPLPGGDATVDEMSEASFPASDPPATWTWEVPATDAGADDSADSSHSSD